VRAGRSKDDTCKAARSHLRTHGSREGTGKTQADKEKEVFFFFASHTHERRIIFADGE
jgi:hypothetical protein